MATDGLKKGAFEAGPDMEAVFHCPARRRCDSSYSGPEAAETLRYPVESR
jgi:hypothetical protein